MKKVIFAFLSIFLLASCQQTDKKAIVNNDLQEDQFQIASLIPSLDLNNKDSSKFNEEKIKKEDIWLKSLITNTPQEGRELAITMARKTIAAIQTDPEIRIKLRDDYAQDTKQLINTGKVVAIEFQTIAQANNYWRDK